MEKVPFTIDGLQNLKIELNNLICKNDIVYLKGSRSMKLESLYKGDI